MGELVLEHLEQVAVDIDRDSLRVRDPGAVEEKLIQRRIYEAAFRQFAEELERARRLRGSVAGRQLDLLFEARRREMDELAAEVRRAVRVRTSVGGTAPAPAED